MRSSHDVSYIAKILDVNKVSYWRSLVVLFELNIAVLVSETVFVFVYT